MTYEALFMKHCTSELLEKTNCTWQHYSKELITIDDAKEIVSNMKDFIRVIIEINEKRANE